jgi:hypothetical protein
MSDSITFERKELIRLIRTQAQEVAYEVIDEHLDDYEHTPKKTAETETEE